MIRKIFVAILISIAALASAAFGYLRAQSLSQQDQADIPAYHADAPKLPLPATLDPKLFTDTLNQNIYALAANEKAVLYQQPCYCHCDREVGHKSLLECYVDRHASVCSVCKMEAVFAYQQTKLGKTPAQIREAIMQGKWKEVDMSKYNLPPAAK